mgnify:CR=1 FL=1
MTPRTAGTISDAANTTASADAAVTMNDRTLVLRACLNSLLPTVVRLLTCLFWSVYDFDRERVYPVSLGPAAGPRLVKAIVSLCH